MYDSVRGKMTAIDCIKVNADYESVLFHGKQGPAVMNEALEFLAFYLQDLPVLTDKDYTPEFFSHVESLTGRKPRTVRKGMARNWWGPLENPEKERWMNSKLTSFEFALQNDWVKGSVLSREEVLKLTPGMKLLVKDPFNMSGKGLVVIEPGKPVHLPQAMSGKLIVEPLLKRTKDFSHFVFPDGTKICYENLVDERFQYRGTLFSSLSDFSLKSLSFYEELDWSGFETVIQLIRQHYGTETPYGYSIDSFVYEEGGEKKIFPLCEVNARRTMGLVAYELVKTLGRGTRGALTLREPLFKDAIKLSPEGVRFDMYLSFE